MTPTRTAVACGLALASFVSRAGAQAPQVPPPSAPVLVVPGPEAAPAAVAAPPPTPEPPTPEPSTPEPGPPEPPPPVSVAPPEYPFPLYQAAPPPSRSPKSREGIGAPSLALWVGARAGWDFPLGSAFRDRIGAVRPESSFVSSGPVLQIDLGARIARRLVPFAFAARTFASGGAASTIPSATPRQGLPNEPPQGIVSEVASASSTLVGLGMRYLFSPDDWGAAVEISYAYRLTRAEFRDGTVYRADAPGLLRLGAGLEVRVSRIVSLSPMLVASVGSYSDVTTQRPGGRERSVVAETLTHGYVGLVLGGGFDLFSRWE